ncbi:MAG TPA: ATP-binding protein [Ktedonobacteraceae bacterium]|jgi:PAS domain S-box-containing protein|nr:ATP-binding protein [Ktedonobacteraceae bacterium]
MTVNKGDSNQLPAAPVLASSPSQSSTNASWPGISAPSFSGRFTEKQLALLLQASHDAFIVHDESGRVLFWNSGASRLYGWSEEEIQDKDVHSVLKTEPSLPLAEIEQTLREKGSWEGELEQSRSDGEPVVVASRWIVLELPESASMTILEVNRDITELRRTLQHLRFLTEASKLLVSSLDYPDVLVQVAQHAVPMIADWCRIDLFREDGKLYPLVIAHVDPGKVAWAYELSAKVPYDPDAPGGVAAVIRTRKSEFFPFIPDEMLVAAAKDEQELEMVRSIGFSSVITVPIVVQERGVGAITLVTTETKRHYTATDLTMAEELANRISMAMENAHIYRQLQEFNANLEQMVIERTAALTESSEALRQLNAELQRSNQELQDFAYVASHDLQEPLRKIQAFGNLLEEEYGSVLSDGKTYLDRMRNAASRMQVLINDLLMFSRVTTKALPFTEVDLNVIGREVIIDLEAVLQATGGAVEIDMLPIIEADPLQMRQLLQNLIGNALKFHRPGVPPHVFVSAEWQANPEASEEQCVIAVRDNGIGFDEKYLDRIFTVFQRLHSRGEYEGTGIGLAVVRKIVERHGGSITARSTVGEGSTFLVTLPLRQTTKPLSNG